MKKHMYAVEKVIRRGCQTIDSVIARENDYLIRTQLTLN